ncbi:MAG: hypothetical protein KGL39_58295, partial [Patescibacteria group bacterium]|nr:hypothetical protein [Patescibacteria group bacterium]
DGHVNVSHRYDLSRVVRATRARPNTASTNDATPARSPEAPGRPCCPGRNGADTGPGTRPPNADG